MGTRNGKKGGRLSLVGAVWPPGHAQRRPGRQKACWGSWHGACCRYGHLLLLCPRPLVQVAAIVLNECRWNMDVAAQH
jgi:hypothetical protein